MEALGGQGLQYVLKSLTPKLKDLIAVLVYLVKNEMENAVASKSKGYPDDSQNIKMSNELPAKSSSKISYNNVPWMKVLQTCRSRLVVKDESELRKLLNELKDNRIAKLWSDSEGCMFVSLLVSINDIGDIKIL
jgi:hypothetical protein